MTLTDGRWQVLHGDSASILRDIQAESVHAFITDPPYGTNDGRGKRTTKGGDGGVRFSLEWDRETPTSWLAHAERLLVDGGAVAAFTDAKRPGDLWDAGEAAGLQGCHTFYWKKPDPPPTPRPNFVSAVEVGVYLIKPGPRVWSGGGMQHNVFESPLAHKADGAGMYRFHPTQKPVVVMAWLIGLMTNPGDLVVDPFCGSGSTGVAALRLGRRFLGIEQDAGFVDVARARCRAAAVGEGEPLGAATPPRRSLQGDLAVQPCLFAADGANDDG